MTLSDYKPIKSGLLVLTLAGCAMAVACGNATAPKNDGFIEASDATKHELGVVRWSNEAASIEGYDESGQSVVSLEYAAREQGTARQHMFSLREHAHVAVTQISIEGTGEDRVTTILRDEANDDSFVEHVLERMEADFAPKAGTLTSSTLRPLDIPWTQPSQKLVCGNMSDPKLAGADTCMKHKADVPQEAKSWALACADYVDAVDPATGKQKNPGATRDNTACKVDAVYVCRCEDHTRDGWYKPEPEKLCHKVFAGVGQLEPALDCNDPSKMCPKQIPECISRKQWCNEAGKPDNC